MSAAVNFPARCFSRIKGVSSDSSAYTSPIDLGVTHYGKNTKPQPALARSDGEGPPDLLSDQQQSWERVRRHGPITYMLDGKQWILFAAGDSLFAYSLNK